MNMMQLKYVPVTHNTKAILDYHTPKVSIELIFTRHFIKKIMVRRNLLNDDLRKDYTGFFKPDRSKEKCREI